MVVVVLLDVGGGDMQPESQLEVELVRSLSITELTLQ